MAELLLTGSTSEITISIVLSFIITWTIGLLPPVLLRYWILNKPLDKGPAAATAGVLAVINLFIFIALGSQSKTHSVLILIVFVSYWILRRRSSSKQNNQNSKSKKEVKEQDRRSQSTEKKPAFRPGWRKKIKNMVKKLKFDSSQAYKLTVIAALGLISMSIFYSLVIKDVINKQAFEKCVTAASKLDTNAVTFIELTDFCRTRYLNR